MAKKTSKKAPSSRRTRLSQSDVPGVSLEQALRIPRALHESYAAKPAAPLRVAAAMDVQPTSGPFRQLCGAAIAYGLTEGGYNASEVGLTALGKRIVRPTVDGDDLAAKKEALLQPRVIREFLEKYNGSPIPKDAIARNVLADMGVPDERASEVLALIVESAEALGLITEIKNNRYVDLDSVVAASSTDLPPSLSTPDGSQSDESEEPLLPPKSPSIVPSEERLVDIQRARRVFITHGKNQALVDPIKRLLAFGEMEPVVSVEKQSVSQPVPEKVMNDMRSCGAAIIHVEDELRLMDSATKEHIVLNPNVLIEIGAAMALFGRRFILLVKRGVTLPSNLQGLFEVRYDGDSLDGDATMRLLEAINEMKKEDVAT